VVQHELDGRGPCQDFVGGEVEEQAAGVDDPTEDGFGLRWRSLGQELGDGEYVITFNGVVGIRWATKELEDEGEYLTAAFEVAQQVTVEEVINVDLRLGVVIDG
jgi:hypothetical protein